MCMLVQVPSGGWVGTPARNIHPPGRYTPQERTPPGRYTPGTEVGGIHPTGMHSCEKCVGYGR